MSRPLPSVFIPYTSTDPLSDSRRIDTAPRLTAAECALLGLPCVTGKGETRAKLKTRGMGSILVSVSAIVEVQERDGVRLYPPRVAFARSMGTDPCLRVRVAGKRGGCFLSSRLFTLPCGELHNVALLMTYSSHPAHVSAVA